MWNKPVITITAILLSLAAIGLEIYEKINTPKIGFIRIKEVFEKFDMKKEMELKFDRENVGRQRMLDSVGLALQNESQKLQVMPNLPDSIVERFTNWKNDYLARKQQFDNEKQTQTENYNSQIILRMSQYVKDYGKANGYRYILGDDGNGNIMFAEDAQDLTTPVITYINEKYSGEKK